jgi:hypothetical protein
MKQTKTIIAVLSGVSLFCLLPISAFADYTDTIRRICQTKGNEQLCEQIRNDYRDAAEAEQRRKVILEQKRLEELRIQRAQEEELKRQDNERRKAVEKRVKESEEMKEKMRLQELELLRQEGLEREARAEEARRKQQQTERCLMTPSPECLEIRTEKLQGAYRNYIIVKQCYESRQGYAFLFIVPEEMAKAKTAVAQIESKLKWGIDKDAVWSEAGKQAWSPGTGAEYNENTVGWCKGALSALLWFQEKLYPEAARTTKDF